MKSASPLITARQRSDASHIEYFGDLDPAGLRIPYVLNEGLVKLGAPPMRPATLLYELLLSRGIRRPMTDRKRRPVASELDWLPENLRVQVANVFKSDLWLPQEGLGLDVLLETFPTARPRSAQKVIDIECPSANDIKASDALAEREKTL